MTYYITPVLGLTLATPSTAQAFETTVVNNDFVLLENGIAADRTRITVVENRSGFAADLDALVAVATPSSGWERIVTEGGALFVYNGTVWVQRTPAIFATTTIRDTAYAKGSAAFKIANAQVRITSAGYLTTWSTITSTWRGAEVGLVAIPIPSITGTGVVKNGLGEVVFTASPTIGLGQFASADFDNYRIIFDMTAASGVIAPLFQMMDNLNAAINSATYSHSVVWANGATVTSTQATAFNFWQVMGVASTKVRIQMDLFGLFLAQETGFIAAGVAGTGAGTYSHSSAGGGTSDAASRFGISITTNNATTMTGKVRVYGYNNAS